MQWAEPLNLLGTWHHLGSQKNMLAKDSVFLWGASFVLSSFDFLSSFFHFLKWKQRNFKWANSLLTKVVLSISWWVISSIRNPAWVCFFTSHLTLEPVHPKAIISKSSVRRHFNCVLFLFLFFLMRWKWEEEKKGERERGSEGERREWERERERKKHTYIHTLINHRRNMQHRQRQEASLAE